MSTVAAKSATGAIGAGQKNMMGGDVWPPMATCVNPKEQQVIVIAKFAVAKYNALNATTLVFINVEYGFWWNVKVDVDVGVKVKGYMLAITTQDANGTYSNVALVCDTEANNGHTYDLKWYNNKNN